MLALWLYLKQSMMDHVIPSMLVPPPPPPTCCCGCRWRHWEWKGDCPSCHHHHHHHHLPSCCCYYYYQRAQWMYWVVSTPTGPRFFSAWAFMTFLFSQIDWRTPAWNFVIFDFSFWGTKCLLIAPSKSPIGREMLNSISVGIHLLTTQSRSSSSSSSSSSANKTCRYVSQVKCLIASSQCLDWLKFWGTGWTWDHSQGWMLQQLGWHYWWSGHEMICLWNGRSILLWWYCQGHIVHWCGWRCLCLGQTHNLSLSPSVLCNLFAQVGV